MAVRSQFNNRLAPLGAFGTENDTFTGLAEETILGNAISVNYKSDQNTLLKVQQSPDGENFYIEDQKLFLANQEYIFQHPAVLQFFRVIIQNQAGVDQTYGDLITSLVQIQTDNINVNAVIGDINPTKDGILTYGLNGTTPLATRVDASGSLITTFSATGASPASATVWGKDSLGESYPLPLTTGGAEIAMSITDPLPAGTNTIGTVKLVGNHSAFGVLNPTVCPAYGGPLGSDAVGLVTTMDAKFGNASVTICGIDQNGTGDPEYISSVISNRPTIRDPIRALYTFVDNMPEVQVVGGRETPYIGFATPATNIPAVYADGIPGVNVTGGWSYINTLVGVPPYTGSRNKINWYVYNSATPDTDFTVSQISSAYMVINQKSTLGVQAELPWITIYTRPDSGVNNGGTFYKNALLFGGFSFIGTTGMMLLYTGEDPVGIHPEITGANRYKLEFNAGASTTTLAAASGEGAYLASIQTDSTPAPNGTRNFVFSEFSMMWEQSAIPLPISQSQVQVFDKALNASAATLVTDLSGITITANKLQVGGTVAVSNFPATQPVSGSVSVSNLPATQPVSGSVSVSNFPATQPVSGTFWQATQPVSGTVAISNFPEGGSNVTIVSALPAGTNAIGSVTVSNFPAGGSEVSVTNFPATQPISGTVAISNFPEGGSNVTVVSALPTGTNVIGAVNTNIRNYSLTFSPQYEPQYQDSVGQAFDMTNYKSVDLIVKPNYTLQANEDPGITLVVEISIDGNDWAPLANYTLNFKGQYPRNQAINNIQTNALYIRLSALTANNPTGMALSCQVTWIAKY